MMRTQRTVGGFPLIWTILLFCLVYPWVKNFSVVPSDADSMGMNAPGREYRRRYAFNGFESAGFYQYAAADSSFFLQMRCRADGKSCSVHAQCCSAFCTGGKCDRLRSTRRRSPRPGSNTSRLLQVAESAKQNGEPPVPQSRQPTSSEKNAGECDLINQNNLKTLNSLADGQADCDEDEPHYPDDASDKAELPNAGDLQLHQALEAALKEFRQSTSLYKQCWAPFLERQYLPDPSFSSETCPNSEIGYPSREQAEGTFKRVFEENAIYWGTHADVPPYSYFIDANRSEFWGFDVEVVQQVMRFFNEHYSSEVELKTLFIPSTEGLFNNVVDALYNGIVDGFSGKFTFCDERCDIVKCSCSYEATGSIALLGGVRLLNGKLPDKSTNWNDSKVVLGVIAHDSRLPQVAEMFSKVTLRLFWSLWDMGEQLLQGGIHGSIGDISVIRFLQTFYDIYCPNCQLISEYPAEELQIGFALRKFPPPAELRRAKGAAESSTPLPSVFTITAHTC